VGGDKTQYCHQGTVATQVYPDQKTVLALAVEPIAKEDEVNKNDRERNAHRGSFLRFR
jgi:hypothetical protein